MTYMEVVQRVRDVFEYADVRNIFEHIAMQVNIQGEAEGVFYFEIAGRQMTVEPYDYYDHDGIITTTAQVLIDMCDMKYTFEEAYKKGLIEYEGNERKLRACINNIVLT